MDGSKPNGANCGVYRIDCRGNGCVYVGGSLYVQKRLTRHRRDLRLGIHPNNQLQLAWMKYGAESFVYSILEYTTEDQLLAREQYWIDELKAFGELGFNQTPSAGSSRGRKASESERATMSIAQKLSEASRKHLKRLNSSNEHKQQILRLNQSKKSRDATSLRNKARAFTVKPIRPAPGQGVLPFPEDGGPSANVRE